MIPEMQLDIRRDFDTLLCLPLFAIAIWAFCRFHYFPFDGLEHFAGRERKDAGLWDAPGYLLASRREK